MDLDKSPTSIITIEGEQLENVDNFVYLGSRIDADGKISPEIRRRLAIATSKLNAMSTLWKTHWIDIKIRILKTCIFPVATYGCETWTITRADEKKISAFEMKCYRKILKIPWTAKVSNKDVLEQIGLEECQLMNIIKRQKLSYFGHIKRHDTIERLFMEGLCEGRRGRGRPRRRWIQDVSDWMGLTATETGRRAQMRNEFREAVWEATSKKDPP